MLRRQDHVGTGLRKIACDCVEGAIRSLTRQPGSSAASLEFIAQAEAVLALIETDLPQTVSRRDRALMTRVRKSLSDMTRPAELLDQLDLSLPKAPDDPEQAAAVKTLRKHWSSLAATGQTFNTRGGGFDPAIYRMVADMAELRGHLGTWPVDTISQDVPPRGLRRSYTRARRLIEQPITSATLADALSALSTLDLQLAVLIKACPPMLKGHRKLLGKAIAAMRHVELELALEKSLHEATGDKPSKQPSVIQRLAEPIVLYAEPALAETSAAFDRRIQSYWSAWRYGRE